MEEREGENIQHSMRLETQSAGPALPNKKWLPMVKAQISRGSRIGL